eukprot:670774-Alexandrium_andersonii.AAC.1
MSKRAGARSALRMRKYAPKTPGMRQRRATFRASYVRPFLSLHRRQLPSLTLSHTSGHRCPLWIRPASAGNRAGPRSSTCTAAK